MTIQLNKDLVYVEVSYISFNVLPVRNAIIQCVFTIFTMLPIFLMYFY